MSLLKHYIRMRITVMGLRLHRVKAINHKTHLYICTLHLLLLESSQQLKILQVLLKMMVEWLGSDPPLWSGPDLNRNEQQ